MHVLCVDPDRAHRTELEETVRTDLGEMDPVVEGYESAEEVGAVVADDAVACLVTEYDLPDGTGLDLARRVRAANPDASVILYTDTDQAEISGGSDRTTVTEYVNKTAPAAPTRVAAMIEMTVSFRSQISYPLPDAEEARLAALADYEFEEGPLNDAFDRLTDLAVRHFAVSSASVNIIEEHEQRLLACRGLEADSTTREASICTFTIVEEAPVMTVPDVREDPRFRARHEELEALGIRSYMGTQLRTPEGLRIGTLCVYDDEPGEFPPQDREYLRTLADLGADLLAAHAGPEVDDRPAGPRDGDGDGSADQPPESDDEGGLDALGEAF